MANTIASNIHLVPILKGAVDPKKGIILRTYYIRPEKLQTMIQQARQIPAKAYIVKIPHYNALEYAVNTGNITKLSDYITRQEGGKDVWANIVMHHKVFDESAHHYEHQQRYLQNVYGFIVSTDQLQHKQLMKNLGKAATKRVLVVQSVEKPIKPKLKRGKRVREQVKLGIISDPKQLLEIQNNQETSDPFALRELDYGKQVHYKQKLYKENDGKTLGETISALLNYLNVNPRKAMSIASTMISKQSLNDRYKVAQHTLLKSSIYTTEPNFWKELLLNLITIDEDPNKKFGHFAMLLKISPKDAVQIASADPDTRSWLNLLRMPVKTVLTSSDLTPEQKKYYIASMNEDEANKILWAIPKFVAAQPVEEQNDTIGALISNLKPTVAYQFIRTKFPQLLDLNSYIKDLYTGHVDFGFHLLEMLASKAFKYHYVPYKELLMADNSKKIFSHAIATKLFPIVLKRDSHNLTELFKDLQRTTTKLDNVVKLGLHIQDAAIGLDNQVFYKLNAIHPFELFDQTKHNVQFVVPKSAILHFNESDNKVLVGDPINQILPVD